MFVAFMFIAACQSPSTQQAADETKNVLPPMSREQLLSGTVEKKWYREPEEDKEKQAQLSNDTTLHVRFIFYRNYTMTSFGAYGSRHGHWSLDVGNDLSFHFDGPDSLQRFNIVQLDSAVLRLRNNAGDVYTYKSE